MDNLRVGIIQAALCWEDKARNLEAFSIKIKPLANKCDVIVLPEMFTTGFSMDSRRLAESMDGYTVQWMKEQAAIAQSVITGSFICKDQGAFFNRLLWVTPSGGGYTYDKRHLFQMGTENAHYTAGGERLIVELKGWNVSPFICYDLRFPVWSRNTKDAPYDVALYVANWPAVRQSAWNALLAARAIENQAYVVGVNRVGQDGLGVNHSGYSKAISPAGEELTTILPGEETVELVTLSYDKLADFRRQFPVLSDSDNFSLKN